MPKLNRQQKLVKYLEQIGFQQVEGASAKYIKMVKGNKTYWLGRGGALRAGPTISGSTSHTDNIDWDMINEAVKE